MPRRICVYCGSRSGENPAYTDLARQAGEALVARGFELVYGGGSVGMMGVLADAVLDRGGQVLGIIPRFLDRKEVTHPDVQHMEIVESMHVRKARFVELADAFLALPGGFGTLEELFETITWAQLNLHQNPIGLVNIDGYFDGVLTQIDHMIQEGFVKDKYRRLVKVGTDPGDVLDQLMSQLPALPVTESGIRKM